MFPILGAATLGAVRVRSGAVAAAVLERLSMAAACVALGSATCIKQRCGISARQRVDAEGLSH